MAWLIMAFLGALGALLCFAGGAYLLRAALADRVVDRLLVRLVKDPYPENLWDLAVGLARLPPHSLLELELRAEQGDVLERPLGSIRRRDDWAALAFSPAQLVRAPAAPEAPVDLATVIGPRAPRPLRLELPIMVGALPYGVALGEPFVIALARGAARAGTAYNAGSGPLLEQVRQAARPLILQYTGAAWNRDPAVLCHADMIEIRFGHGARAALGRVYPRDGLPQKARDLMGLAEDEPAVLAAPVPGAATPAELRRLVPRLRRLTEGGPVGVKLAATHDLEQELAMVLEAGVDVIAIDGGEGGTHGSPPLIADDFGIPTAHALERAVRFLERSGVRESVSLVISGGLHTPAHFLKALALGADAVYIGTAAIMACTHGQLSKAVPFEPITQIAWATGQQVADFDPDQGAATLAHFLRACAGELAEGVRALGKPAARAVGRTDLVALDGDAAARFGLPPSWRAPGAPVRRPPPGRRSPPARRK